MNQYYRYLDTIGYINPDQGEYGTFYFMDSDAMQISDRAILNELDLSSIQANPIDQAQVMTIAEYLQARVDSLHVPFLDTAFHSDYSYDTNIAFSNTMKEAARQNIFLTELEQGSFFSSSAFDKVLKSYAIKLKKY